MWNPEQYLKFAAPRVRPALDLLIRVPVEAPGTVYDLGCGAGNVTRMLAQRWPAARIVGIDDSPAMLAKAAEEAPNILWQQQGIADWAPARPADVIYSNAALHWLPEHETLFPRLMAQLAPGGVLAVQMPRNFNEPSHMLIWETLRAGPWRTRLEHLVQPSPVAAPDFYYGLLSPLSSAIDIWETQYLQVLEGKDPVKEWTKGTWLRQFLEALDEADRPVFEEDYSRRLREAYPVRADGGTLFPFRRLFLVARRRASPGA
jgi:trans-aconitate 2-methyltransferase